jgi:exosortase
MRHPQPFRYLPLKLFVIRAENEVLRLKDAGQGGLDFGAKRLVLRPQIQQRHRPCDLRRHETPSSYHGREDLRRGLEDAMMVKLKVPVENNTTPGTVAAESAFDPKSLLSLLAPVIWMLALLVLCFAPTLRYLVQEWMKNDDMSHGFFVPVVAAYIAWSKRDELAFPAKPNKWGIVITLLAALQQYVAILGAELFLARTAFIISVMGVTLFLCGTANFKKLLLPLCLLFFMVPLPAIVYSQITFPLQLFASQVAETVLTLIGIPVLREGNVLELPSQRLSVVEACSGIRSLLSLSFLSLVYGYFFDPRPWMKFALLAATVPIAIVTNAARVTVTGILSERDPELAKGFFHSAEGWLMFMIALALLILTHQVIHRAARFAGHGKPAPAAG